jgi:threonine aldolase
MDFFAIEATRLIREKFNCPEADVHFVASGTQANLCVLSAILRPWESVIAADSGHINQHEAGAIEATGHKINSVRGEDGKVRPHEIQEQVELHNFDQMVVPKAVYISQSTELGTVYSTAELTAVSEKCKDTIFIFLLTERDWVQHSPQRVAIWIRQHLRDSSMCSISAARKTER